MPGRFVVSPVIFSMMCCSALSMAQDKDSDGQGEILFNDAFLRGGQKIDVRRFSRGNPVDPGLHRVEIHLNEVRVKQTEVRFLTVPGQFDAQPCFSREELIAIGLAVQRLDLSQQTLFKPADACVRVETLWPQASSDYDPGSFRLDLRVPQIALARNARGYVDPQLWDGGISVGFVNYTVTTNYTSSNESLRSDFASLNSGLNMGLFQLRSQTSYTGNSQGGSDWQNIRTFLQRSLPQIEGRVVAGQSFTSGRYFDSVGFTGLEVASDERMMPDARRGYAPVVRGIARTQARVTVRQNNFVLYETTVPPGPFALDDLYPTGFGGDLQVTVTEADGSQQIFSVPFSSVPEMLREGAFRYALSAGRLRDLSIEDEPYFVQASYSHGVSSLVTLYGAGQVGENYRAMLAGAGLNTAVGAFSADLMGAHASLRREGRQVGSRAKLNHTYRYLPTDTYFSLSAYRYLNRDFLSLRDTAYLNQSHQDSILTSDGLQQQKQRLDVSLSQPMKQYGQVFLVGSTQTYWDRSGARTELQMGYSGAYRSLHYTVNVSRVSNDGQSSETRFFAGVTIPLESFSAYRVTSTSSIGGGGGEYSVQTNINATRRDDNALSFGVQTGYDSGFRQTSWGGNIQRQFSAANVYGSASQTGSYKQFAMGMAGSMVVHDKGVTFGQSLGDSFALIEAPGAAGARLSSHDTVIVDRRGYAVVPYLTPFRMNTVSLSPTGMNDEVELKETSQMVAPYSGAGIRMTFETLQGRSVLIALRQSSGEPIPIGADVYDEKDNLVGVVGQGSRAYIRSPSDQGQVTVRWGASLNQQCVFRYLLPEKKMTNIMTTLSGECLPVNKVKYE